MGEGNLWKVDWKKTGRSYRVFLADDPAFHATAKTIEDAIEQLEERIIEERDDAVPHFEWLTPLPHPVGVEGRDFLHILGAHHRVDVQNIERLFENSRCERCHNYFRPRTDEPIRLDRPPNGDLVLTDFGGKICSARFAQFLGLNGHTEFKLLPIVIAGIERTDYLELRTGVTRSHGARKGAPSRGSFRCRECATTLIVYMPDEADYFQFVAASLLPNPSPLVFAIGSDYEIDLAISGTLRPRIHRFKDVGTSKIGILNDDLALQPDTFFQSMSLQQ